MQSTEHLPDLEALIKPIEAARILGMSKSQLRELTTARRIPAVNIGIASKRVWRYYRPALREWIENNIRAGKRRQAG